MPESGFTADAVFAYRSFRANAWIIDSGFQTHDINTDHHGILSDLSVAITENVGPYVAFTPVHWILVDFAARLTALETSDRVRDSFTADAWVAVSGTYGLGVFKADSVISAPVESSFVADAAFITGGTFTADASIIGQRFITADALLVGDWHR